MNKFNQTLSVILTDDSSAALCYSTVLISCVNKCVKVFKNGLKKICGRQPLKILKWYGLPSRPYHFKFFKGCLLRILLCPFLHTFTQMCRALKLQMQTHGSNLGIDAYYSHKHWYRYLKTEHTFCQLNCNQNLPL